MSQEGKELMSQLLRLPAVERHAIADQLLSTLTEEEQDDALEAELNRRSQEVRSGKVKALPLSALKAKKTRS
ncbi:MAG: addiction module protein [Gemmatales bacterium]